MSNEPILKLPSVVTGMPGKFLLNPVQQEVAVHLKSRRPMLVCSHTSTGKTVTAQMMARRHLKKGKKVIYIGITKALAEQKQEEWANPKHLWSQYNIAVISGDHSDDPTLQARLKEANIVIATPEAMLSRLWKSQAVKNQWINDVGILIVDEIHLCGAERRGAAMEVAVVEMQRAVPNVQLLGLSATLKNREHFEEWWTNVTGDDPIIIHSDWRPVPIERYYYEIPNYTQEGILEALLRIVSTPEYSGDQMLIACWNKSRQRAWAEMFKKRGYTVDVHNADRTYEERQGAIYNFMMRQVQFLFGTSGVIAGMNMPAKHCIATCVEFGDGTHIPAMDITQALGRAGRVGFDKIGIQHILIPAGSRGVHQKRIEEGEPVLSQLSDERVAATHFLGAVYCGNASYIEEALDWIRRTLFYVQRPEWLKDEEALTEYLNGIIQSMLNLGFLKKKSYEQDGEFALSGKGKIAAQMLLDPFHFADLMINFRKLDSWQEIPPIEFAKAFGACEEFKCRFSQRWNRFVDPAIPGLKSMGQEAIVPVTCIYEKMMGNSIPDEWNSRNFKILNDQGRWLTALSRAVNETKSFDNLNMRDVVACSGLYAAGCNTKKDWANARHPSMDDMREQLSVFTNNEVVRLAAIGVYSLRDARKRYGLVASSNAMSLTRMQELGISIPSGRRVPKMHASEGAVRKMKSMRSRYNRAKGI